MRLKDIARNFMFRYLLVIFVLIFYYSWSSGLDDDNIDRTIYTLAVYAGLVPLIVLGWPAFHFGYTNYKINPIGLSYDKGLWTIS